MNKIKIGLVDYDTGNISSLKSVIKSIGFNCIISKDCSSLNHCDALILPGVGSFNAAINSLKKYQLETFIFDWANSSKPLIGICLGMQLLGMGSSEHGGSRGLGLIPHAVEPLGSGNVHIGWNSVEGSKIWGPLSNVDEKEFYFNHGYAFLDAADYEIAASYHQDIRFSSIVKFKRTIGVQFHPEKSQEDGKILLSSMLKEITIV